MLVRRLLAVAGTAGLLIAAPAGAALAAPAPSPSATSAPDQPSPGPSTTTDCGLPPNDQPSDTSTATIEPSPEPATPGLDPGVICIASGVNTGGGAPQDSAGGGVAPVADPTAELPRTGPAPLLPAAAVGSWLLLLGVVTALAGHRRTVRA